MTTLINARDLRAQLPAVVRRVRQGARFTVLYRSRPAFEIGPVHDLKTKATDLEHEPFFGAKALGSSATGAIARQHDEILYR